MTSIEATTPLTFTLEAQEVNQVVHVLMEAVLLPPRIQIALAQKIQQQAQQSLQTAQGIRPPGNGMDAPIEPEAPKPSVEAQKGKAAHSEAR